MQSLVWNSVKWKGPLRYGCLVRQPFYHCRLFVFLRLSFCFGSRLVRRIPKTRLSSLPIASLDAFACRKGMASSFTTTARQCECLDSISRTGTWLPSGERRRTSAFRSSSPRIFSRCVRGVMSRTDTWIHVAVKMYTVDSNFDTEFGSLVFLR